MTWKLYFQTGFEEGKAALASAGEEMAPAMQFYLEKFKIQPLTIWELFQCNLKQAEFKNQLSEWWNLSASLTSTGRPFDGIICPTNPSASFPHNFPIWWGYTSLWNIVDYPATTLPLKNFRISAETDPKDSKYIPSESNFFDKMTHDMCKLYIIFAERVAMLTHHRRTRIVQSAASLYTSNRTAVSGRRAHCYYWCDR